VAKLLEAGYVEEIRAEFDMLGPWRFQGRPIPAPH
jgi:hypothetical protein